MKKRLIYFLFWMLIGSLGFTPLAFALSYTFTIAAFDPFQDFSLLYPNIGRVPKVAIFTPNGRPELIVLGNTKAVALTTQDTRSQKWTVSRSWRPAPGYKFAYNMPAVADFYNDRAGQEIVFLEKKVDTANPTIAIFQLSIFSSDAAGTNIIRLPANNGDNNAKDLLSLVVEDLDEDGQPEIIVTFYNGGDSLIQIWKKTATSWSSFDVALPNTNIIDLAVGDVDLNSPGLEIVTSGHIIKKSANSWQVDNINLPQLSRKDPNFPGNIPGTVPPFWRAVLANVDSDASQEIFYLDVMDTPSSVPPSQGRVFLVNGEDKSVIREWDYSGGDNARCEFFPAVDANLKGKKFFLPGNNGILVYDSNSPGPQFIATPGFPPDAQPCFIPILADVTGDGKADILTSVFGAGARAGWDGQTLQPLHPEFQEVLADYRSAIGYFSPIVVADFDNDHRNDVIMYQGTPSTIRVIVPDALPPVSNVESPWAQSRADEMNSGAFPERLAPPSNDSLKPATPKNLQVK